MASFVLCPVLSLPHNLPCFDLVSPRFCAPAFLDLPIWPTGGGPFSVSDALSGRSPTRPVHLYPRRPCYTNLHPLVPHGLLTPPIMVGGATATVEGQQVPPWQAWGLSVLSATSHVKSPSKFSLPALFLTQPLAIVLRLLGLLGPRPLGLPSLPVLRDHWAMSLSRPEVWQPAVPLILLPPCITRTPSTTFTPPRLLTQPAV